MIGIVLVEVFAYMLKYCVQPTKFTENIDAEAIYLEINIRKRKWLIIGTYKPQRQNDTLFLESLSNNHSTYLEEYSNILPQGDFNMTPENESLTFYKFFQSREFNT